VAAVSAVAGPIPGLGGPKPGFEVFSTDNKGGGWVIHHMPGRGDTLWGCKDLATVTDCTQVFFSEWKTASKMRFLHVTDKSQKGWLVLSAPAMGEYLYACQDPEGTPACRLMELELRPPMAKFDRTWPQYDCKFECGDKAGSCAETLPETDARRVIETVDKADFLMEAAPVAPGPVNLYACKGLESSPTCELTVPNWLTLDREDVGISKMEDIEVEAADGSVTFGPGVLVSKVDEESVAWTAGLREGMVILKVGAFDTNKAAHARYLMLQYPALSKIPLTMSDGKVVELTPNRKPSKK
jgi:hypothetical protein